MQPEVVVHSPVTTPVWAPALAPVMVQGGGFNPISALFNAGEQGIAVPDLTPGNGFLFQDSAGTTPVTAFEQPVGLILDRSKGLVLGPELVTNGDFSNGATGWTTKAGASITGGALSINTTGDTLEIAAQQNVIQQFKWYKVSVTCTSISSGIIFVALASAVTPQRVTITSAGTIEALIYNSNTLTGIDVRAYGSSGGTGAVVGVIANITVRELPGNHIIQATSTKRPTLSARYNMLERTDDPSNAYWTKNGITPSGNTLTVSASGGSKSLYRPVNAVSGVSYTATLSITASSSNSFSFGLFGASGFLTNTCVVVSGPGTITGAGLRNISGLSATTPTVISMVVTANSATLELYVYPKSDNNVIGDSVVFNYADLRLTIDTIGQPAYQRVGAATDYDTAGFFPYLRFDGTDDSMATAASVDFTGTDKMTVFAGLTKLSDAAAAIVSELSAVSDSNNGSYAQYASGLFSGSTRDTYIAAARGSSATLGWLQGASYQAPITNVASSVLDIAQSTASAQIAMRINGTVPATVNRSSATGNAGNFGNYTLFLGGRNNASLFFNGRLYPFFIRGAATDAGTIVQTEQFLKTRMPVSF